MKLNKIIRIWYTEKSYPLGVIYRLALYVTIFIFLLCLWESITPLVSIHLNSPFSILFESCFHYFYYSYIPKFINHFVKLNIFTRDSLGDCDPPATEYGQKQWGVGAGGRPATDNPGGIGAPSHFTGFSHGRRHSRGISWGLQVRRRLLPHLILLADT